MLVTAVLAVNAVDGGAMWIALFIMVMVAVALILLGCGIALKFLFRTTDKIHKTSRSGGSGGPFPIIIVELPRRGRRGAHGGGTCGLLEPPTVGRLP